MFSCEFEEIFKKTFSYRTPLVAASVTLKALTTFRYQSRLFVFILELYKLSDILHSQSPRLLEELKKISESTDVTYFKLFFQIVNPFLDNFPILYLLIIYHSFLNSESFFVQCLCNKLQP